MSKYQALEPCLVCQEENLDRTYHHVISRGAGGPDKDWNLMPLCFGCHEEIHKKGLDTFAKIYSIVQGWLKGKGWELNHFNEWFFPHENK